MDAPQDTAQAPCIATETAVERESRSRARKAEGCFAHLQTKCRVHQRRRWRMLSCKRYPSRVAIVNEHADMQTTRRCAIACTRRSNGVRVCSCQIAGGNFPWVALSSTGPVSALIAALESAVEKYSNMGCGKCAQITVDMGRSAVMMTPHLGSDALVFVKLTLLKSFVNRTETE